MTYKPALFVVIPLFASLVFPQSDPDAKVDRVLHFTSIELAQDFEEIGTVVRSIADIRQASVDAGEKALVIHATAAQAGLAEWLFTKLDQPIGVQNPTQTKDEYQVSNSGDDVVRVFYLSNVDTLPQFHEIVTAVRSNANIRQMFTYNRLRAIAVRGTADQTALAEFLLAEVDRPVVKSYPSQKFRNSAVYIYPPGGSDSVVKVFYLPYTKTVQDFQLLVITARTATDLRRMFTYNATRAALVRGTAEEVDAVEWLLRDLDPENQNAGPHVYRYPTASDDMVRIFYLAHTAGAQRFEAIASQVKAVNHRRIAIPYEPAQAIIVRGTNAEIALADRIIKERDQ
jgi:type II secretory pathway component GspD/PulD (secretin)